MRLYWSSGKSLRPVHGYQWRWSSFFDAGTILWVLIHRSYSGFLHHAISNGSSAWQDQVISKAAVNALNVAHYLILHDRSLVDRTRSTPANHFIRSARNLGIIKHFWRGLCVTPPTRCARSKYSTSLSHSSRHCHSSTPEALVLYLILKHNRTHY